MAGWGRVDHRDEGNNEFVSPVVHLLRGVGMAVVDHGVVHLVVLVHHLVLVIVFHRPLFLVVPLT